MEKLMIDLLGTLIGISATMLFYDTFLIKRSTKWYISYGGILLIAILNVFLILQLLNTLFITAIAILTTLVLSFYFSSGISSKMLFAFIMISILFAAEQFVGIAFVYLMRAPIEMIQSNTTMYMMGVITSKLLALFIVLIIRTIMKVFKGKTNNQFNLIMAFMPLQSIIICFVVSSYSLSTGAAQMSFLGVTAILISLSLVYVTMILVRNQQRALQYKSEYDLSQQKLNIQIAHYQKLYDAQREVRAIRHDMVDTLTSISGLLSDEQVAEAVERINGINSNLGKTADINYTGHPSVDAVINAKIIKAEESGICIKHKFIIEDSLKVDQFDVAIIIANALDNAIEGVMRSTDAERNIRLSVTSESDYIAIFVKNHSSGLIHDDFRTSKPEKANHGFGLERMKTIAKKYNGDVNPNYIVDKREFILKILLENKAELRS
jgi:hypothetical protein